MAKYSGAGASVRRPWWLTPHKGPEKCDTNCYERLVHDAYATIRRRRLDELSHGSDQQDIDDLALNGQLLFNLPSDLDIIVGLDWEDVDRPARLARTSSI